MKRIKLPCSCEYDTLDSARNYFNVFIKDMGIKNYYIKRIYRYNSHKSDCAPCMSYRCIAFDLDK